MMKEDLVLPQVSPQQAPPPSPTRSGAGGIPQTPSRTSQGLCTCISGNKRPFLSNPPRPSGSFQMDLLSKGFSCSSAFSADFDVD